MTKTKKEEVVDKKDVSDYYVELPESVVKYGSKDTRDVMMEIIPPFDKWIKATNLGEILGIGKSSIHYHISKLEEKGLIRKVHKGKTIYLQRKNDKA